MQFLKLQIALVVTFSFLLAPIVTFAVEPPSEVYIPGRDDIGVATDPAPALPSCFEYYRFGSTPMVVQGDVSTVSQGGTITFRGTLTNENAYPIINAGIYAKIQHKLTNEKTSFGPNILDWFTVQEGLTLKAGESKPVLFTWVVPKNAEPGSYKLATFVAADERFNLSGLTFTNDIIGSFYNFTVVGNVGTTRLDNTSVVIGTDVYHPTAFSPAVDLGLGVPITISVPNTSASKFTGVVKWKLYLWDGLREETVIDEKTEPIEIAPGGVGATKYTIVDSAHTVYYALAELIPTDTQQAKSFIAVRFVGGSNAEPRINFVGVTKYPADGATFFTCVHSSGRSEAPNVRVVMEAVPERSFWSFLTGRVLAQRSFEGTVPGALSAITVPLANMPSSFTLTAKVYQDNVLIDSVAVPYNCSELGGSCADDSPVSITILALAAFSVVSILTLFIFKRRKTVPVIPHQ